MMGRWNCLPVSILDSHPNKLPLAQTTKLPTFLCKRFHPGRHHSTHQEAFGKETHPPKRQKRSVYPCYNEHRQHTDWVSKHHSPLNGTGDFLEKWMTPCLEMERMSLRQFCARKQGSTQGLKEACSKDIKGAWKALVAKSGIIWSSKHVYNWS